MTKRENLERELAEHGEIFIRGFEDLARSVGDKTFFYYGEQDVGYSYAEFNRLANSFAHGLASLGVGKGDRVSLFLMNPLATTIAMFGIWKIGAVFCPINFNYRGKFLAYHLCDTDPEILITEQRLVPTINEIRDQIPTIRSILHRPARDDHDYDADVAETELAEGFRPILFDELLHGDTDDPKVAIEAHDTANIIYTSGTTGNPKGVVQSHRWLLNYVYTGLKFMSVDDVMYNDLPLYHVGGAFINVVRTAWAGGTVAVWDKFSPNDFWKRINSSGATMAVLLDVMVPWLMAQDPSEDDRRNTLKLVHMQPLPQTHNQVARRFGIDFVTVGYGSTEAGAAFLGVFDEWGDEEGTPGEIYKGYSKDELRRIFNEIGAPIISGEEAVEAGFMGRPVALIEAAVVDDDDRPLDPGACGQVVFRGKLPHMIFTEYFNKPEETLRAKRNSWYHSGDVVYMDEDGIYYFVDRMGGFLRVRGENLSSSQVEGLIEDHPKVQSCACFPIPARVGDEEDIVVYVVLHEGQELSDGELRTWIEAEMPKFMWPRHIRFIDELPVTPTFKVQKHELKERILRELET